MSAREQAEDDLQQHPSPIAQALAAANALLVSSLAAGDVPSADDTHISQQIAAYRASIESISTQLEHLGADQQEEQQQQQQQQEPASTASEAAAAEVAVADDSAAALIGLGEEGVDYTVSSFCSEYRTLSIHHCLRHMQSCWQ